MILRSVAMSKEKSGLAWVRRHWSNRIVLSGLPSLKGHCHRKVLCFVLLTLILLILYTITSFIILRIILLRPSIPKVAISKTCTISIFTLGETNDDDGDGLLLLI